MNKELIIKEAPVQATHYAVNKETSKPFYVVAEDSNYTILPRNRFKSVLGYNRFDIYSLEDMKAELKGGKDE